jgi:drug/metabolite transporter (DMT)-like permease
MSDPTTSHRRALLAAVAVTVLWSSSWVLIRWGLDDHGLRPVGFAGLRYGAAAIVLTGWVLTRSRHRTALAALTRPQIGRLAALGLVFYTLTQGAQFVAIDNQPAATTSLVLSLTPLAVSFVSNRLLDEVASRRQIVGSALIAAGALAYFSGSLGFTPVGMAAALVGLGANTVGALLGRSVNRTLALPAEVVTVVSMGIGAGLLLAIGVALEGLPRLDGTGWLIVAWLAVVNTAVAFTWWNWSLRHLTATASAGINNTMLVQIALLGWIFLDETPGAVQWLGMAVVSLGIFLAQAARARAREITPGRR